YGGRALRLGGRPGRFPRLRREARSRVEGQIVTDYTKLLDAETWAFIERTNSFYPPETIDFTIAEQRAVYGRLCEAFFACYPEGVTAETTAIETSTHAIPIRIYRSARPNPAAVVVYYHGGGFMLGGLES